MTPALRLAVIGDPVEHSLSPQLHRGFFAQSGIAGTYETVRVAAGDGARAIAQLRASGYAGVNVTTPLKEEAFAAAQTHDAAAVASGAVNTLVFGECIDSYNTDGVGVLGAFDDAGLPELAGVRVLVLGAGPTARAAVVALDAADAVVTVWNRTAARAEAVVREFDVRLWQPGTRVDAVFSALVPQARLHDAALVATVLAAPVAIDANYGARATLGAALGRSDVRDGSAMLRASARASFALFQTAATPGSLRRGGDSNSRDL